MEEVKTIRKAQLDEKGHEIPDPTPLRLPIGFKEPESLQSQIQRMVRGELSRAASENGFETFEESDDFEIEDDDQFDIVTPYEMEFDPVLGREVSPDMVRSNEERYRQEFVKRAQESDYVDKGLEVAAKRQGLSTRLKKAFGLNSETEPAEPAQPSTVHST